MQKKGSSISQAALWFFGYLIAVMVYWWVCCGACGAGCICTSWPVLWRYTMSLARCKIFVLVFAVEPTHDVCWRECSAARQIEQFDWIKKDKKPVGHETMFCTKTCRVFNRGQSLKKACWGLILYSTRFFSCFKVLRGFFCSWHSAWNKNPSLLERDALSTVGPLED